MTLNLPEALENVSDWVVIDLGFASDTLRGGASFLDHHRAKYSKTKTVYTRVILVYLFWRESNL